MLETPAAQVTRCGAVSVLRDDLAHPYINGNKLRKLDALWPQLLAGPAAHLVTCGGVQSAHLVALAALCAESRGMLTSHLLVRGEAPAAPTGHALLARLLAGTLRYVPRRQYADRGAMLAARAAELVGDGDPASVAVVPEGGALPAALLGSVRLVAWLAATHPTLAAAPLDLVLDCGTGTTAAGLALGATLARLPWRVVGVEVGGARGEAPATAAALLGHAQAIYELAPGVAQQAGARLHWVPRPRPRRFGRALPGDGEAVRAVAAATGMVLDPIWTLAAWETAQARAGTEAPHQLMLHTGGALGLCGAAQRWPDQY